MKQENIRERRCIAYKPNGYECFQLLKQNENGSWYKNGRKMSPRAVYDLVERNKDSGEYEIVFGALAEQEFRNYAKKRKARDSDEIREMRFRREEINRRKSLDVFG